MPGRLVSTQNASGTPQPTRAGTSPGRLPPAGSPSSSPIPSSPPIPIPHGRRSARAHDPTWATAPGDDHTAASVRSGGSSMGVTYAGNVFPMSYGTPQQIAPTTATSSPGSSAPRGASTGGTMPNGVGVAHAPTLDSIPSQPSTPSTSPPAGPSVAVSFPTPIRSGWSLDVTNGRTPQVAVTAPSVRPPAVTRRSDQGPSSAVVQGEQDTQSEMREGHRGLE